MSTEFAFPTVAASLDGKRAVGVLAVDTDHAYRVPSRDAFAVIADVRLQPLGKPVRTEVIVTGSFEASWNHPMQTLGWTMSLADALPGLALIELGEFMDGSPAPAEHTDDSTGLSVLVSSNSFSVFEREPATEEDIYRFVQSHTYWAWRNKVAPARFTRAEAARLGVDLGDLMNAAFRGEDELWNRTDDHELQALPQLIRAFEAAALRPRSVSPESESVTPGAEWAFEVALSFAGEQREYVSEVARILRIWYLDQMSQRKRGGGYPLTVPTGEEDCAPSRLFGRLDDRPRISGHRGSPAGVHRLRWALPRALFMGPVGGYPMGGVAGRKADSNPLQRPCRLRCCNSRPGAVK